MKIERQEIDDILYACQSILIQLQSVYEHKDEALIPIQPQLNNIRLSIKSIYCLIDEIVEKQ